MAPVSLDPAGLIIGQFRALSVIGEGGMGVVYKAQRSSGELVALKTVRNVTPKLLGALRLEIAALQAIRHSGVVHVLEHGVDNGLPWYAMELLEGRTLADFSRAIWSATGAFASTAHTTTLSTDSSFLTQPTLLEGEVLPQTMPRPGAFAAMTTRYQAAGGRLREALLMFHSLCAPLAHIHARGVVHRDLKPANIFIRKDGSPVLVDFGLFSYARGTIGRESLPASVPLLGTLSYVSPEQIQGKLVDARADLYSLGCIMHEVVTGRRPFDGDRKEILARHLSEQPAVASDLVDGVSPQLDRLILGLLAKSPQERIGYAADVAAMISEILGTSVEMPEADYLYRPQMAGRQDLLARLSTAAANAAAGHGGFILLGGESGIGKTFLVSEFSQSELKQKRRVITGECVPVATSGNTVTELTAGPLHPLRRLFRTIVDECRRGSPETVSRLLGPRASLLAAYEPELGVFASTSGELRPPALPSDAALERILKSVTDTLVALSADSPLILILDDLQWADELTLAFLTSLTPAFFEGRRLLIVGTYRVEEVTADLKVLLEKPAVERMVVGRLVEKTVEAVARDMLAMKTSPPPLLVRFLAGRSEGNPFFLAEHLRLLVAERILNRTDGRWSAGGSLADEPEPNYEALPVPRSLQGIITRRLARLREASKTVIEAASVLGREFAFETLSEIVPEAGDVAAALREATSLQIVEAVDDHNYRFSHDKLRETAYAGIDTDRLPQLHRAAAVSIERQFGASQELPRHYPDLAHHYRQAGEVAKSIEFLERAGREALSKSANREAVSFLKDAIEHATRPGTQPDTLRVARWHRMIGVALHGLGRLDESAVYLRGAAALLGRPAASGRARLVISVLSSVLRQVAHRLFPRLLFGSGRHKSESLIEATRTHHRLMEVLYFSGDALPMMHACISSLNLGELAGESPELATAYTNAFAVCGIIPARKLAEFYRRRANEMNERFPDPMVECHLRMVSGVYAVGTGAWEDAKRELGRGIDIAHTIGYRRSWEDSSLVDSVGDFLRGDFQKALAGATSVYQSALRGDAQTQSWGLIQQGYALLVQGRFDDALSSLRKAEPLISEHARSRVEYLWFHAALARTLLRLGDRSGALTAAGLAFARLLKSPPLYFSWIEAYPALAEVFIVLWQGALGKDRKTFERFAGRTCRAMHAQARVFPAAEPNSHLWEGKLLWYRGKHRRAISSWQRAIVAARNRKMPHEEASALQALAIASSPDDPQRKDLLGKAYDIFHRLGAVYDLQQIVELQGHSGGHAGEGERHPENSA